MNATNIYFLEWAVKQSLNKEKWTWKGGHLRRQWCPVCIQTWVFRILYFTSLFLSCTSSWAEDLLVGEFLKCHPKLHKEYINTFGVEWNGSPKVPPKRGGRSDHQVIRQGFWNANAFFVCFCYISSLIQPHLRPTMQCVKKKTKHCFVNTDLLLKFVSTFFFTSLNDLRIFTKWFPLASQKG